MINTTIKINNINFTINNINIENDSMIMGNHDFINSRRSISIDAQTSNDNYIKVANWADEAMGRSNYKKDLIYNTVQIIGIFPIDYSFNHNHINVTFSVDYINGNMELFNLQKLRKEKLEKIEKIGTKL